MSAARRCSGVETVERSHLVRKNIQLTQPTSASSSSSFPPCAKLRNPMAYKPSVLGTGYFTTAPDCFGAFSEIPCALGKINLTLLSICRCLREDKPKWIFKEWASALGGVKQALGFYHTRKDLSLCASPMGRVR